MAKKAQWYRVESSDVDNTDTTVEPTFFDVEFGPVEYIKGAFLGRGIDVRALRSAPTYQAQLKLTAFEYDGKLYVSKEVIGIIVGSGQVRHFVNRQGLTIGRRAFHLIDETTIERLTHYNLYPRRNDRERVAQVRNGDLIKWLASFV